MEITVIQGNITEIETEVVCLGIFEGVTSPGGAAGAVDTALDGVPVDSIPERSSFVDQPIKP